MLLTAILSVFPLQMLGKERQDSVVVSLITCWPGAEVYELCGHEAIRVRGEGMDSVWNYGVFNFNEPNFVYRFVKGETDYMLAGYPFAWFMPEYMAAGRRVVEQDLNLTPEETARLLAMLREEAKPENCKYRYNYVKDNCATRIVDRLDSAASERIIFPDSIKYGTFRKEMRAYHKNYPWYQFGIDLALGSGIDMPIGGRGEMFVPLEMMDKVSDAHFSDGRPMVKATRVLYEGRDDAVLPPTPWIASPAGCSVMFFITVLLLCVWMGWQKRILKAAYAIWFGLLGIAGCVITFLVFASVHEATSPNILILWLNPLQLIIAACIWSRRARRLVAGMCWYNMLVIGCMLIVWPFQRQSANFAFFPLMGATMALAIAYCVITMRKKANIYGDNSLFNNREPNSINAAPAERPARNKRHGSIDSARRKSSSKKKK